MGHAFHMGHEYAKEFLKALGLDHSKVRYIKLEMGVDMITTVEVEYLLDEEHMGSLLKLGEKYALQITKK